MWVQSTGKKKKKSEFFSERAVKMIALLAAENVHVNENWIALVLMCIG